MKIKTANGNELDCSQLTNGEFLAKQHELVELAVKNDIPFFAISFSLDDRKPFISQHLLNDSSNTQEANSRFNKLLGYIGGWLYQVSRKRFVVAHVQSLKEEVTFATNPTEVSRSLETPEGKDNDSQ